MDKKTIVFDFDGVIHRYSKGWQDGSIYDKPVKGIKEVIDELRKDYKIVIVSTRSATEEGKNNIINWLKKYDIKVDDISKEKPPALIYVDDRAINFDGNCKTLMKKINNFKGWTEKNKKICSFCGKEFFKDDVCNNRLKYCSIECRIEANIRKIKKVQGEN